MSGSNESFVQLPPDGTGKLVDAFQVTTPQGAVQYRQGVVIGSNDFVGFSADVDELERLKVSPIDKGFLETMSEDIAQADGSGPGLLKPPNTTADGSEPSLVVQISPNTQLQLDQSVPAVIGGVGPDGANRRMRIGTDGGLLISDAVSPQASYQSGQVGNLFVLDTSGYESVAVQMCGIWSGTISFYCCNDLAWPVAVSGMSSAAPNALITTATANGQYVFPVMGRYFIGKITAYTSGLFTAVPMLRSSPMPVSSVVAVNGTASVNASQIGGTTPVTANVAGMLAIGGNVAPGSAPTAYPILTAGIDYVGNTRRLETDTNGALISAGILAPGYQLGAFNVTYTRYTTAQTTLTAAQSNINPVLIGGVDQTNAARPVLTDNFGAQLIGAAPASPASQSITDLLTQILGILRVQAHYLYELRSGLAPAYSVTSGITTTLSAADEPDSLFADYTNQATSLANMIN